ncbi:MAG TPA: DUF413 domain-containing protein [Opitutaceae bacterium]|nr:DUF413 domain-containing protein [Opitutaceae bacterium]
MFARRAIVSVLSASALFVAGCSYLGTAGEQALYTLQQAGAPRQRVYKHLLGRDTFFVFGRLEHEPAGVRGQLAVVALHDGLETNEVVDVNWFSRDDSYYGMNLPEGDYRLVVACDRNADGRVDQSEAIGGRRLYVDLAAAPDRVLGDCDIDLRRRVELGATRFTAAVPAIAAMPSRESLFYPKGSIRSLDEPLFAPRMATIGMYQPAEFLERAPMMFYALEEDIGYKVPIVFVHGIGGSPRDFAAILARLDRTRYRPWFFYYPSGQDLSQVAAMFHRLFLSGRVIPLDRMPLVIVAHSMGGVVVREAMNLSTGSAKENHVGCLITIASPLAGHPGARFARRAPVVIPSWRDLDPEGDFIRQLHRRPLPAGTSYHLFYANGEAPASEPNERTDGVVPVAAQLEPAACREAVEQTGFAASHTGVLRDAAVISRIEALLSEVKSPFPEDHLRELRRGGYAIEADGEITPMEAYLIREIGYYMDALVCGRLQPCDRYQVEFVAACRGERPARLPAETAWRKLERRLPQRVRN